MTPISEIRAALALPFPDQTVQEHHRRWLRELCDRVERLAVACERERTRADRAEQSEAEARTANRVWFERAEKAERERDEERHLADIRGAMLSKVEHELADAEHAYQTRKAEQKQAEAERDAALAMVEARPAIDRDDAEMFLSGRQGEAVMRREAGDRIYAALRAHAKKGGA